MVILYNLTIRAYFLIILIVSGFKKKAKQWVNGRKDWQNSLKEAINTELPTAWFHCASLGEFEQGRPLIEAYKEEHPDHQIVISFFSPSGYEIRKNYQKATYVCYLPLDTKRNAKQFLSIVKPKVAFFIKYEFWYHFLNQLRKSNTPTYLVSAIFRPKQVFFQWYGWWNQKMLHCFRHIFLQNTQSQELLASIGICNSTVAGDTRFDRVYATAKAAEKIAMLDEFCQNSTVIVAGSTWPKDEDLLLEIVSLLQKDVKLIIAPHEINSARIDELISGFGLSCARYTNPNQGNLSDVRILFIDTIGILSSAYGYGHIAYIGGGFGVGIHNTLEPATFGIPVIFGPNYAKFGEAKELIALNAAFSINNSQQLKEVLNCMLNEKLRHKAGSAAKQYVEQNIGATQTILSNL